MRELVNLGLAVLELAILGGNGLLPLGHLSDKLCGQRAQLLGVQAVQFLCGDHGQQFAKPGGVWPLADAPIAQPLQVIVIMPA